MLLGATGTNLGYNLFAYCESNVVNSIDPSGHIKLEIHVQVPRLNSTVVWAYKNGGLTAGHAYVVLDPQGDISLNKGKKIARGFRPKTNKTTWVAIGRVSVTGLIEDQPKIRYDARASYIISKKQFKKAYDFLYSKPKKYNVVTYNCSTFAIDALNKTGIKHNFKKRFWNIGTAAYITSLLLICSGIVTYQYSATYLLSFSLSYGYTPARLAYDINKGIR